MIAVKTLLSSRLRQVVAVTVVLLVAVAASVLVHRALNDLPDDAVLRYGDIVVTKADLDDHVDSLAALYGVARPEGEDRRDDFERDVAKSVAVSLILDDAAEERDIVISEKASRDTLSAMLEEQLGPDPQQAFTRLLADFGVSEKDILREISRQQAIARLFQEVTGEVIDSVTPEEIRAHYDADPAAFGVPERRDLANIVVPTREEALDVVKELRRGAGFGVVARAQSRDDATRNEGGHIGVVQQRDLEAGYADVAFAAQAGATFGPVETTHGWNVGKVVRVVPAEQRPFVEVEPVVADEVRSARAMKAWSSWLADRMKSADVEYAEAYRPANPNEPPAQTPTEALAQ